MRRSLFTVCFLAVAALAARAATAGSAPQIVGSFTNGTYSWTAPEDVSLAGLMVSCTWPVANTGTVSVVTHGSSTADAITNVVHSYGSGSIRSSVKEFSPNSVLVKKGDLVVVSQTFADTTNTMRVILNNMIRE